MLSFMPCSLATPSIHTTNLLYQLDYLQSPDHYNQVTAFSSFLGNSEISDSTHLVFPCTLNISNNGTTWLLFALSQSVFSFISLRTFMWGPHNLHISHKQISYKQFLCHFSYTIRNTIVLLVSNSNVSPSYCVFTVLSTTHFPFSLNFTWQSIMFLCLSLAPLLFFTASPSFLGPSSSLCLNCKLRVDTQSLKFSYHNSFLILVLVFFPC